MILSYLWINNYKNIKDCYYNFDNNYTFVLEDEQKIIIKKNKYESDFLYADFNTSNVTAIIGENGTGKSNMYDFMKEVYTLKRIQSKFILVYRENNDVIVYRFNFNKEVEVINETECTVQIINSGFSSKSLDKVKEIFEETKMIFYSDVFDYRFEDDSEMLTNISTNFLSKKEKNYRYSEIGRFIKFLSNGTSKNSKDKSPKNISFGVTSLTENKAVKKIIDNFKSTEVYFAQDSLSSKLVRKASLKFVNDLYKNDFKVDINSEIRKIYNNMISCEFYANDTIRENKAKRKGIVSYFFHVLFNELTDKEISESVNLINFFAKYSSYNELINANVYDEMTSSSIMKIIEDIKVYYSAVTNFESKQIGHQIFVELPFEIDNDITNRLLSVATGLENQSTPFVFDTIDFSSGEKARLNMFSRLYEIRSSVVNKDLILLIDEAGLYYHPKWQKDFFKDLLEYTNEIFPNNKVQIVIATHSPFLLSDIPKENAVFLVKDKRGKIKPIDQRDIPRTFAANINDLLSDNFFMDGGLIGSFAKSKIADELSHLIADEQISNDLKIKKLENFKAVIGDDFIHFQLEQIIRGLLNE